MSLPKEEDSRYTLRFVSIEKSRTIKTGFQRFERPVYDYYSKYSPCREGCPAGHDIAWALYLMSLGRSDLAYEKFKEESPFPSITGRVCYHPCESVCNRGDYDRTIAISSLERSCSDINLQRNGRYEQRYPESVAVIGAGPAGLTCAYHLTIIGYKVVVYDANAYPGGVLSFGIPAYRLPKDIVNREVSELEAMGVEFRANTRIGTDIQLDGLLQTYPAVFLGIGLSKPRKLDIPVPDDDRFMSAIDFLQMINSGQKPSVKGHVVVIGGGDVAIDAARSARRLGATKVTICCLENKDQMPGHPDEIEAALEEDLQLSDGVVPTRLQVEHNRILLSLSKVRDLKRNPDGSMSYNVSSKSIRTLNVDFLIYAVGQQADISFLPNSIHDGRRVEVDLFGRTRMKGVFAAGDIIGTYNVVNAISSGKRAAMGIDAFLRGIDIGDLYEKVKIGDKGAVSMRSYLTLRDGKNDLLPLTGTVKIDQINLDYFPRKDRIKRLYIDNTERINSFKEVNLSLGQIEALEEAERCFNCGICNMCGNCFIYCPDSSVVQFDEWGFNIDLDHCKGCGVCVQECPRYAMSLVSEWEVGNEATTH